MPFMYFESENSVYSNVLLFSVSFFFFTFITSVCEMYKF